MLRNLFKKKPKNSTEYRVCTKVYKGILMDNEIVEWRDFSIFEVDLKNGLIVSYSDMNVLEKHKNIKELKNEYKLIKNAFKKPVIDLDNFPNVYHGK